jgi:cobalt-zinc-cadmium efflux system outer membrane protein
MRIMRKNVLRGLVFFLLAAVILDTAPAPALGTLLLPSLIEEAKNNNPEILAAKKRYEASKERIPQAKALDDTTITLDFERTPGNPLRLNKTPSEERMLSVSQMFPLFGKLALKGKIALVESQMFAAEYKDKELDIVNQVKNAYYDLFMNYKEIELNEQSLQLLQGVAKSAEAKYVVGKISQEELFKISLEMANLSNNIANLKLEQPAKNARLNALINRDAESLLWMPELGEDAVFNKDITSLYQLTIENQPELLTFSYAIERNKYARDLAKKSVLPDIAAGITMRGITSGTIGPWDLMMAFTVPLWFWTKQRYEIKEAIVNLEEAQAAYQAMKNKALAQTKELFTKVEMAKNKINLYKANLIPLLESSINSSLAGLRSGKLDVMGLLDSQRMLIETKMNYYKAIVEYNMSLADLERDVGVNLQEVGK